MARLAAVIGDVYCVGSEIASERDLLTSYTQGYQIPESA